MMNVQSRPVFLTPQRLQPELPLFIFLPGMDGTGQLLRAQTAGLEVSFDVRSLAIPLDDLTRWDVLTTNVAALIRAELAKSSQRPVYLCGESFGGCLALKLALHSPQLFDRIILVNPASSFASRPWLSLGALLGRWLPEPLFHLSSTALLPLLGDTNRMAPGDRQSFYETVQSVPQATTLWRMMLLGEFNFAAAQLQQITQPVLLLAGANDRLLPSVEEVRRLAKLLPNSQVVILPHSGHTCLLEADVNLYELMKTHQFLVNHAVSASPHPPIPVSS